MTRFPLAAFALILIGVPAFAQSSSYSFDNFDTRNGVQVYVEPVKARAPNPRTPNPRTSRGRRTDAAYNAASRQNTLTEREQSAVALKRTVLSYAPAVNTDSPLRGYTT